MTRYQHNGYVRGLASNTELFKSGTFIITDEWSSVQEAAGRLDEVFIAESIVTRPAGALADDEDDGESRLDIQVIDVKDDDNGDLVYNVVSPALTSGDVDADWKRADITGKVTSGGSVTTPDQDALDLIGRAAGGVYDDDEPLDFAKKVGQRDRNRRELDPAPVDPDRRVLGEVPTPPESQRTGLKIETRS